MTNLNNSNPSDPLLSVIIPSYLKSAVIVDCLERLTSVLKDVRFELIIVIDGDEDKTASRLESFSLHHRVLTLTENHGKGFAVRKGFEFVSGDFVCIFDADLDIDPTVLMRQFNTLTSNDSIAGVIANKYHPDSSLVYPLKRKVLSFGLFLLQRLLFALPFRDTQTGAKMFRYSALSDVLPQLRTNGFLYDIELLYKLKKRKSQVAQCAVEISHTGHSTIKLRGLFSLLFSLINLRIKIFTDSSRIINFFQRHSN
jgi:glycosyltransferase involved in cell wall biosynthesis